MSKKSWVLREGNEIPKVMTKPERLTIPVIPLMEVGEEWCVPKKCMDRLNKIYDEFFASSSLSRDAYYCMVLQGQLPDDYVPNKDYLH